MKVGDYVEIRTAVGPGKWAWAVGKVVRKGHITAEDEHCFEVRTDDGEIIRDVREHFRRAQ